MLSNKQIAKILITANILTNKEIEQYEEQAKNHGQKLQQFLVSQKIINPQQLFQTIAQSRNLPFINLDNETIRKDILLLIPEPIATTHSIIAFDKNETSLKVALLDPDDIQIIEFLRKKTGLSIDAHLTTPESISEALKLYHKGLKAEFQDITNSGTDDDGENLKKLAQDVPVIRIVDTLLEYAVLENASDIHIEPTEKQVTVRYRIDGVLKNVMTLPKSVHAGVIARIKILSNLKLDEHRLPQDGRFKVRNKEFNVSFRVSTIPAQDGEKIVLRLLNETTGLLSLEQLGFLDQPLEIVKRNISKPHGIILVTGPTGSGKTTTLYAILNILNQSEVNITTIEDPIEYKLAGVNQSQVNTKIGYTFAAALRAYLRQDPDIIMVGEIRDKETAEIAIHAALTGHLVLSTLHTNDAPSTLPRINEMGVPSFLVSSTANVIIAQRLARRICPDCIESYTLSEKEVKKLQQEIDFDGIIETLKKAGATSEKQKANELLFYRGKGCKKCGDDGYKGRVGLYEVMEITDTIKEALLNNTNTDKLRQIAREEGMITILEDGFIKAQQGQTTIEEILRVTKE